MQLSKAISNLPKYSSSAFEFEKWNVSIPFVGCSVFYLKQHYFKTENYLLFPFFMGVCFVLIYSWGHKN